MGHGTVPLNQAEPFLWSGKSERAAVLLAADDISDREIAAKLHISRTTLHTWKQHPEFAGRVGGERGQIQAGMLKLAIAKKHERVKVLDDLQTDLLTIRQARAAEYAALAAQRAAEPETKRVSREVFGGRGEVPAGGETGLILRTIKQIGSGPMATIVEEFGIDTGMIREIRALHEQAARELGQWDSGTPAGTNVEVRLYVGIDVDQV